ncbi:DUF998 domain-containing protein [Dermabacteraceae bacterium TAE3-ERU27]|nr:DUF998 domain-containing protein [Dermabacteraceae bacterium TAE3-ERU27]
MNCFFIAAAITYSSWIFTLLLTSTTLSPVAHYVSEYAASNQPWHLLYRVGDGLSAVFIAAGLWTVRSHKTALWWSLAAFALFTLGDSLFPFACAIHQEPCASQAAAWQLPLTHYLHSLTSMLLSVALITAMGIDAVKNRNRLRVSVSAIAVTAMLLSVLGELDLHTVGGLLQRVQLVGISIWLVLIAPLLAADHRSAADPRRS